MIVLVVAIVMALTAGGGGTIYASERALPGDALYQVKTTLESIQLSLAASDESKAQTHLDLAAKRLAEIQTASAEGRPHAAGAAAEALTREIAEAEQYLDQARAGGRDIGHLTTRLAENLDRQQAALATAGDRVPQQAKAALMRAAEGARHGLTLAATRGLTPTTAPGLPEGGPARSLTGAPAQSRPSDGLASSEVLTVTVPGLTLPVTLTQTISDVARLATDPLVSGQSYNGLLVKLNAAEAALGRGQADVAGRLLDAFMNELNAMERSGHISAGNHATLAARYDTLTNRLGEAPEAQAMPPARTSASATNQPPSAQRRGR